MRNPSPAHSIQPELRLRNHRALPLLPDGHGYELVSSVRALVSQKFSVEEELMHVKHVEVKSPHVGVMWKFGRGVISSGPPAALTGEGIKLPFVFEAVREIYRNIFGLASFEKVDRFQSEIQLAGHPVRGLRTSQGSVRSHQVPFDTVTGSSRFLLRSPLGFLGPKKANSFQPNPEAKREPAN
ncbi:hypothetical protein TNCV_1798311 [Trichonephila clavipes]|uniref:Uncharacterized protein n=1 Tax=Trichonephila clavipes TaxID=2585209 RepID=A0A8X6VH11_TRICX|nr:hypothetical protein TNCV_1798311 [Trichonephila clavipes]